MNTYIQKLRTKLGRASFICPAARILIENDNGEFLIIERNDNGKIGIPAGGFEENETIEECIRREVLEETGLQLLTVKVIGISSSPLKESVTYPNGDQIQYFTIEFYSNHWTGTINVQDLQEVRSAKFVPFSTLQQLPTNEQSILDSFAFYKKNGYLQLK